MRYVTSVDSSFHREGVQKTSRRAEVSTGQISGTSAVHHLVLFAKQVGKPRLGEHAAQLAVAPDTNRVLLCLQLYTLGRAVRFGEPQERWATKREQPMRPYARRGKKIRINNRRKFNAGARRVSWEFSPREYPRKIVPLHLAIIRLRKATRQGLTKDQRRAYIQSMV